MTLTDSLLYILLTMFLCGAICGSINFILRKV